MSAHIKKVHVTHEKYVTRTIEEELAILNGREWKYTNDAVDFAINHGWSICEQGHNGNRPGPLAVFNKDDKFIALNMKIQGLDARHFVFEKELPHGSTFDEELQYLNSSEMEWGGPRPIKPPQKQGVPLLRRIVSALWFTEEEAKWRSEEVEWRVSTLCSRDTANAYLSGHGWQVLLNDKHDLADADKVVVWEKYGRKITLVPDPGNPYVARFVEVTG